MDTWIKTSDGTQLRTNRSLTYNVSNSELVVRFTVHGHEFMGGSRRNSPSVTYPTDHHNYVNQTIHRSINIEGHVPQGVEVQVLSSALARVTWMAFCRRPCAVRLFLSAHGFFYVPKG
jgi:hypothetical protein